MERRKNKITSEGGRTRSEPNTLLSFVLLSLLLRLFLLVFVLLQGSFAVSPQPSLLVISLNTILYSARNSAGNVTDPCGQFAWLEAQLKSARSGGMQVYPNTNQKIQKKKKKKKRKDK